MGSSCLPWGDTRLPLLLAPMQGLTNRGLRWVYGTQVRPDALFTEFVRVRPGSKTPVTPADFVEATSAVPGIPLVVQVIGSAEEGVVEATADLVSRGVRHINVNMGCPWGRMTSVLSGGGMFRAPETVEPMLRKLRALVPGSLSVKTRTGIDDERQIFAVLPSFANAGVDFVVVHSRTVKQQYRGEANHDLTREIVEQSGLVVIANGDVRTPEDAQRVMDQTGAAGLMLGRGAIADPFLFQRIRGEAPLAPDEDTRRAELARVWAPLLAEYTGLFSGDAQVLSKLRSVIKHAEHPALRSWLKKLKKARSVVDAQHLLEAGRLQAPC